MITWTEEEKAYYAAFLDGEGCITTCRGSRSRAAAMIRLSFTNTNPYVIRQLAENYAVTLRVDNKNKLHKPIYSVYLHADKAVDFLSNVVRYVTIKREQAELALRSLGMGTYASEDDIVRIRQLNRKGRNNFGL